VPVWFHTDIHLLQVFADSDAEIKAPGFLGYAVDFMKLRPSLEHLRPALNSIDLFYNVSVWSTEAEALAHQETVVWPTLVDFTALDSYCHPCRPLISSWRFKPAGTAEALQAAASNCRRALAAVEQREQQRSVTRLQYWAAACGSDSESDSSGSDSERETASACAAHAASASEDLTAVA
jgi:hypothetical protein